jgi:hypothetical protein
MFMSLLANKFRIVKDFHKPLAVVFNCFSKATWELQTGFLELHGLQAAFLKPPEECTDFQVALEKQFIAPMRL